MCWKRKTDSEPKEPEQKYETEQTVYSVYFVRYGDSFCYQHNLADLMIQGYYFGAQVCYGKLTRTMRKNPKYGYWEYDSDQISDEFEVVTDDKVFEAVRSHFCWIDTEEEWRSISDICYYRDVFVPKKVVGILHDKYSESFSILLASQSVDSRDLIQKALTLYEEGLSPDMRAYLLLVNNENKRTG